MAVVKLNPEEQTRFGELMYAYWVNHKNEPVAHAIRHARLQFPPDRQIAESINGISQLGWMKQAFETAKTKAEKRIPIDGRQRLQTQMEGKPKKEKMPKKGKVFLNRKEQREFAETIYLIKEGSPGLRWEQIFAQANASMPPHKRTGNYSTVKALSWLPGLLDEIEKEMRAPKPVPVVKAPPPPPKTFEDSLIDALVGLLVQQIPEIIKSEKMTNALRGAFDLPPVKKEVKADTSPKKRILIVGMLGNINHELKKEWGDVFDLRCFDNEVKIEQVRDNLPYADYALMAAGFVSHKISNAMRGHHGFKIIPGGGLTAFRKVLHEIAQKEIPTVN